jgi:hypothetical protein
MTNLGKHNELPNEINNLISNAKLEYFNDISWHYRIETRRYCIDFAKDENGKNIIEEFSKLVKGVWIALTPTDEQIKMMWFILNMTPYRNDEFGFPSETDTYESTGTNPFNFF